MIKNKVVIEYKTGERIYELYCSSDSPLGEIHDAACYFKSLIVERINQENEKASKQQEVVSE